jgi:hypothetical protein
MGGVPRCGLVDRKQRSNIRAAVPTNLTGELRLKIGQPDVIRPLAGVDHNRMSTAIVCTVDQKPGGAGLPHFPESDFLFAHVPSKRGGDGIGKSCFMRGIIRSIRGEAIGFTPAGLN